MLNQKQDPVRYEIEATEAWNGYLNEPTKAWRILRVQGNQGWECCKVANPMIAEAIVKQLEQDRAESFENKQIIL